jgi:putative transcriptional regulator
MLFYILNYCVFTTSYNKLWKLLVDKKMSKADLRKASGVSPNTMTKLRRDEPVMLSVLDKICKTLGVNYGDIVDYIADENDESKMSNINTI